MKNFSGKKRDGKEYWHIKRLRFAVQINKYIAKLLAEVGLDFENKSEKYRQLPCLHESQENDHHRPFQKFFPDRFGLSLMGPARCR